MNHTDRINEMAETAHDLHPCDYRDASPESYRSMRDFAVNLAKNAGYIHPSESLIDAIVRLVRKE